MDKMDNIDKMDKVKVQLDKDVVNELIKMKEVGDSYSDVLKRLIKMQTRKRKHKNDIKQVPKEILQEFLV